MSSTNDDILQDKQAEVQAQVHYRLFERLAESEHRYRTLVDNLQVPVFECDNSGRLQLVNAAWRELFNDKLDFNATPTISDHVVLEDRELFQTEFEAVRDATTSQQGSTGSVRILNSHGQIIHVAYLMQRASDNHIVGSLFNISKQKETESRLEAAKIAAEEANRLKSSFLATMSHEIRTPLSAVLGYANLLCADDLDIAIRTKYISRMEMNVKQLSALLNDIIDFSKIEKNLLEINLAPFDLANFMRELVKEHREVFRRGGHQLRYEEPPDFAESFTVISDHFRIKQILLNLLSNAAKFADEGSVILKAEVDRAGSRLLLSVLDSGLGIAAEHLSKIIEPFYQVDQESTRNVGGAGLGLAICDRLAVRLGGKLRLESAPGRGSAFSLELPLSSTTFNGDKSPNTPNIQASVTSLAPAISPGKVRVLSAEDNPDLTFLMVEYLSDLGVSTDTAINGVDALRKVATAENAQAPYDLIFMDMQMPELDGYSATRQLRQQGFQGTIIGITANALSTDRAKVIEAGCDDYIAKPYTQESLHRALATFCKLH